MDHFLKDGLLSGKIICPNPRCKAKLGNYDWAGAHCGCKEWVTPVSQAPRFNSFCRSYDGTGILHQQVQGGRDYTSLILRRLGRPTRVGFGVFRSSHARAQSEGIWIFSWILRAPGYSINTPQFRSSKGQAFFPPKSTRNHVTM